MELIIPNADQSIAAVLKKYLVYINIDKLAQAIRAVVSHRLEAIPKGGSLCIQVECTDGVIDSRVNFSKSSQTLVRISISDSNNDITPV